MLATYPNPDAYFNAVIQAYRHSQLACGVEIEHSYTIARQTVTLHFASPGLASHTTPALEHLKTTVVHQPDLDVYIWDSASYQTPFPTHPWFGERSNLIGEDFHSEEGRVYFHDNRFQMYFYLDSLALLVDNANRKAISWVPDATTLTINEKAAPLHILLSWWFSGSAGQFVHGAGVGTPEGGVLIAGRGGSGKSTTSIACLDSALQISGDDYCLVTNQGAPTVYSLYCSVKIDPGYLPQIPGIAGEVSDADRLDQEKAVIFLTQRHVNALIREFPLKAILLPRITGGIDTSISPASPVQALKALAPSTLFQLVEPGPAAFQALAKLVRQVPAFYINVGTDLSQIPGVILDLLCEL